MLGRLVPAAVALVVVLTACGTDASQLARLQAMPENQLFYPGAVVLSSGGLNEQTTFEGTNYADSGHLLGTNASVMEVSSFYAMQLQKSGWAPTLMDAGAATTEIAAVAWAKDDAVFRLAFRRKGTDPRLPSASDQARFATIFRVDLIHYPMPSGS
ncbi:MAG TPA: hypothetical protein VNF71_14480 [Acidimicrobiales bacterium]|nr:hypothetical protein [Acidimicrobiales bacterium]